MHKHMATLIGNCEHCPTPWKRPTTFLLPSLQSRGAVPSTTRPFQTLRHTHRRRIAPRGWAQPAHASYAHPTGNALPRFLRPISIRGPFSRPQGGLCLRCVARIVAHRRRIAPRRWAPPAHHRHPHPHRKRLAAFPSPNLQTRGVVPSTRRP